MSRIFVRPGFRFHTACRAPECTSSPSFPSRLFSRDATISTPFSSSMAALYEGYTLCGLVPPQNRSHSGVQDIETERDSDHVIVTASGRSVTLYKVKSAVRRRLSTPRPADHCDPHNSCRGPRLLSASVTVTTT